MGKLEEFKKKNKDRLVGADISAPISINKSITKLEENKPTVEEFKSKYKNRIIKDKLPSLGIKNISNYQSEKPSVSEFKAKNKGRLIGQPGKMETTDLKKPSKNKVTSKDYASLLNKKDFKRNSTGAGRAVNNIIDRYANKNKINTLYDIEKDYKEWKENYNPDPLGYNINYGGLSYKTFPYKDEYYEAYGKMTNEDKLVYNYLFNTEGKQSAEKYLNTYINQYMKEKYENANRIAQEKGNKNKVLSSINSIGTNIVSPIGSTAEIIESKITGKEINPYGSGFEMQNVTQGLREGASNNMSNTGKFLYNAGMSTADSLASMITGGPGNGALSQMALNAGTNAVREAKERGANDMQSVIYGTTIGSFEALFEKFSIGNFKSLKDVPVKGVKDTVLNVVKSMLVNASEEGATELADTIADYALMGDMSNYDTIYNNYISNGYEPEQAKKMTIKELATNIGMSALAGGIQGGGMSTVGSTINYTTGSIAGKNITEQDYNELSESIDTDKENYTNKEAYESAKTAKDYAHYLAEKQTKGETITNYNKGAMDRYTNNLLYHANNEYNNKDEEHNTPLEATETSHTNENNKSEEVVVNDNKNKIRGNDISVTGISHSEGGKLFVDIKTEDGTETTIEASEIDFGDIRDKIYEDAANYGTAGAKSFVANYDGNVSEKLYNATFKAYYEAGNTAMGYQKALDTYEVNEKISNEKLYAFYYAGQNDANEVFTNKDNVDNVHEFGVIDDNSVLSEDEKSYISAIAEVSKVKVTIDASLPEYVNGINIKGNIHINPSTKKTYVSVFTHELTHQFEHTAPEEYKEYRDALINYLKETDNESYNRRYEALEKLYRESGAEYTNDAILKEIASNASEEMADERFIQKITTEHPGIAHKFINVLKNLVAKIKSMLARKTKSYETKQLKKDIESFMQIQDKWIEAFKKNTELEISESEETEVNKEEKYSLSEENRIMLADAFNTLAKTQEEKDKLEAYKKAIKNIAEKENQLSIVKSAIKEASFSKGKRDKEIISKLIERSKKLENSIQWWDKQLLQLEASKPLQDVMKRDRNNVTKKQAEYRKETIDKYKNKISATKLKNSIMSNVIEMRKWLLTPNDRKHIPENLRGLTADFLHSIDFSSNNLNKYGEPTARTKLWNKVSKEYEKISSGQATVNGETIYMDIDPDFVNMINDFCEIHENVKLQDMDINSLNEVDKIVKVMKKSIRDANKLFTSKRYETIENLAVKFFDEMSELKDRKETKLLNIADTFFNKDMVDSFSFFEDLGNSMNEFYHDSIREGFNKKVYNTKVAQDYMIDLLKNTDIKKWTGENAEIIKSDINGEIVEFTPSQIMSLYLLNKRDQAKGHIYGGGIKAAPLIVKEDVNILGKKIKKTEIKKQYKPVKVNEKQVDELISKLTEEQIRVADGIAKFLITQTSDWGNEVSMKMYGYNKFTEKNYFPIVSDENYLTTVDSNVNDSTLKNLGITKATVKHASNPLILEDIFDVYTRQVDQMGSYNAFVIPLSDLQKVYNYKAKEYKGSIKQEIERVFGNSAKNYIHNIILDINGSAKYGIGTEVSKKLLSNMKAASVGANVRVVVQQPTSYVRSLYMIDAKYLTKGLLKKGNFDLVKKYSMIAQWKDWGYYEMDTGKQMKNILIGNQTILDNVKDISMELAGKADSYTWSKLWNAVEYEVKDNTNIEYGTEEFYKEVAKRFDVIIDKTQVVDSILHRTQMMRSKDMLTKMVTSFMSEPSKSYNLLRSAAKNGHKEFAKAIGVFILTGAVNAIAQSFIDAIRDEDKEKEYYEKYSISYKQNLIDNINPLNMVPYMKDLYSMWEGYSVNRTDMTAFNDILYACKRFTKYTEGNSKHNLSWHLMDITSSASKLTGIPIKNMWRTVEGTWNIGKGMLESSGIIDRDIESIVTDTSSEYIFTQMYNTLKNKDIETYNKYYNALKKEGKKESYIYTGIRNALCLNDERVKVAAEAKEAGDTKTYTYNVNSMIKDGFKAQEHVVSAINYYIDNYMKEKEESTEEYTYKDKSIYDYEMLLNAYINGDKEGVNNIADDMKQYVKSEITVYNSLMNVYNEYAKLNNKQVYSYDTLYESYIANDKTLYKTIRDKIRDFKKTDEQIDKEIISRLNSSIIEQINNTNGDKLNDIVKKEINDFGKDVSSIRSTITSKAKKEYQKAFINKDAVKLQKLTNILINLPLIDKNHDARYTEKDLYEWLIEVMK